VSDFLQPKKGARLELTYLHGGEAVSLPGEALGPRTLADFELVYAIDGWITYLSDGVSYTVPPGGFILGRPGFQETYFWDPQIPTRHAFFHFGMTVYPSDWPDLCDWPRMRTVLSPVCVSLFRHILQHIYEHDDWPVAQPAPADSRLAEVLIGMFLEDEHGFGKSSFEPAQNRPEAVCRALLLMRKLVEENPMRPLALSDVAAQAHVTAKHLCRLFARSLGHSPMQTFTLLKLQTARPLLMRTNLSVKEISERCGFENPLYFSRRFSQTYGCSPSCFREQLRSGKMMPFKNPLPVDLMTRTRW
jgi:AraC-like DNA-binding protein